MTCLVAGVPMNVVMGASGPGGYGRFGGMWGGSDAVLHELGMTADQPITERSGGKGLTGLGYLRATCRLRTASAAPMLTTKRQRSPTNRQC